MQGASEFNFWVRLEQARRHQCDALLKTESLPKRLVLERVPCTCQLTVELSELTRSFEPHQAETRIDEGSVRDKRAFVKGYTDCAGRTAGRTLAVYAT